MKFLTTLATALLFLTSAVASPTGSDSHNNANQVEKRAGPSGTLISPAGGFTTVINGGTIPVVYQKVYTDWTATYAIDVTLIRRSKNYSHLLASFLTAPSPNTNNIVATFRVPRDIQTLGGGFGSDYQVQIREYQVNPGDSSQLDSVPPFIAAAPYIGISFAG